jgi:ATP-dependent Zn protease
MTTHISAFEDRPAKDALAESSNAAAKTKRSPELLFRLAIHEAGHAVMRLYLELDEITKITIDAPGGGGLITWRTDELHEQTEEFLSATLGTTLAGLAAEKEITGKVGAHVGDPQCSDLELATAMAFDMEATMGFGKKWPLLHRGTTDRTLLLTLDPELKGRVSARLDATYALVRKILARQRPAIEFLAEALLNTNTLEGPELVRLLDEVKRRMLQ